MRNRIALASPRVVAGLLLLGFASGLPLTLLGDTLKVWLRRSGIDVTTIGLLGLVMLPYTLKPLWAPLVDRFVPPLGRRRGWLLGTQILLVLALASFAASDPVSSLGLLSAVALAIAFLSATQDIAGDGWRCDVLDERSRGLGAALWVNAYRLAMLAAGWLVLELSGPLGWHLALGAMAILMLLGVAGTLVAPEPARAPGSPATLRDAVVRPFAEFVRRHGRRLPVVLAFVLLYKLGDSVLASQASTFLVDVGFGNADIGRIKAGVGMGATIVGGIVGGVAFLWLRTRGSLLVFGLAQAASNLAYLWLAKSGRADPGSLAIVVVIENFCGGLAVTGFTAWLMGQCHPSCSATQYALLTALMALTRDLSSALSGPAVHLAGGWSGFFLFSTAMALPGLALLPFLPRAANGISVEEPPAV